MSRFKQTFSSALSSATSKFGGSSKSSPAVEQHDSSAAAPVSSAGSGFRGLSKSRSSLSAPFRNISGGIGNVQMSAVNSTISWRLIGLHSAVLFFTFLGICCFGAVAGFQTKWDIGVSSLTGFALFASLFTFLTSAVTFGIPFVYDKWDLLRSPALFLRVPRTILILESNGALWSAILALATTVSAFTQAGCKDAANDPHADLGDSFQSDLAGWCRTKKAGSIFFWLAFLAWGGLLGFTLFKLVKARRTRPRDEPFVVPGSATEADFSASFSPPRAQGAGAGYARPAGNDDDEENVTSPFEDRYVSAAGPGAGRASMDPYGAFSGDVPEGYGRATPQQAAMSRTMQMATYGRAASPDPFANVRQSLVSPPPPQLAPLQYAQPAQAHATPPVSTPSPHPYPGAYPQQPAAPVQTQPYAYAQPQAYQPAPLPNQQPPFTDPYAAQAQAPAAYADPHQPPYPQQSGVGLPQPPVYHQPSPGWQ